VCVTKEDQQLQLYAISDNCSLHTILSSQINHLSAQQIEVNSCYLCKYKASEMDNKTLDSCPWT